MKRDSLVEQAPLASSLGLEAIILLPSERCTSTFSESAICNLTSAFLHSLQFHPLFTTENKSGKQVSRKLTFLVKTPYY